MTSQQHREQPDRLREVLADAYAASQDSPYPARSSYLESLADESQPHSVGVGPWQGEWPSGEQYDPQLLREGDRRNVVDRYRYWTVAAIRADLDATRQPLQIAIENWSHDFNIGSIVRTANAFNVVAVHIVGRRRWNRRGAMVTDRYLHVHHHPDIAALQQWLAGSERLVESEAAAKPVPLIGVDNVPGSVPLETYRFPSPAVLLFGSESDGLTEPAQAACKDVVAITQHGSTRSMNAGAAAAIAMYAWSAGHQVP